MFTVGLQGRKKVIYRNKMGTIHALVYKTTLIGTDKARSHRAVAELTEL